MYKGLVGVGILIALAWVFADHSYEAVLALIAMLIMAAGIAGQRDNKKTE